MRLAIAGLGRVGRCVVRQAIAAGHDVVALGEPLVDLPRLRHLLRFDAVHGAWPHDLPLDGAGSRIRLGDGWADFACDRQALLDRLPALGAQVLIDCSRRGFPPRAVEPPWPGPEVRVLLAGRSPRADATVVLGVNDDRIDGAAARVVSASSCTANCVLPVARALADRGLDPAELDVTILHPYLAAQNLLDNPAAGDDPSLCRGAPLAVIPAATHLPDAIRELMPDLASRATCRCYRVPAPAVLTIDLGLRFAAPVAAADLLAALRHAAAGTHAGLLAVLDEPVASVDLLGTPWSAAVGAAYLPDRRAQRHRLVLWQDNERAYARRLVDLVSTLGARREGDRRG